MNGSVTTTDEFHKLDMETRQDVIDFIKDFLIYEELTVGGKDYLLVYGGFGSYMS